MKKVCIGIAALAALVTAPAFAADMALKAPPQPALFSWAGWYVGGNLGGAWASANDTVNFAPLAVTLPPGASLTLPSMHGNTFMGGGQVGYNWQSGATVYGLEASIDGQRWNASQTLNAFAIGTLFVPGDAFGVTSNWQGALLGRVGHAWDRTLLYVTGGLAVTNVKVSSTFVPFGVDPATVGSASKTLAGGTVGGGIEYAFDKKWSLGVEGRYTWYGAQTFNTGVVALANPVVFDQVTQSVRLNTGQVTAKVNYHF